MRSIVWSEYISLDGVVDEPGSWSIPYFSDDLAKYKKDELWASDALLLERITYEGFAAAWADMEEIEGDFAVRMNTPPSTSPRRRSRRPAGTTRRSSGRTSRRRSRS
jgi:hypothetical protein